MKLLLIVIFTFLMYTRDIRLFGTTTKKQFIRFPTSSFALSSLKNDVYTDTDPRGIKPKVIFVLGGPGAGKGTQCQKLSAEFGMKHLSAGELLREERSNTDSEYGKLIDSCLKEGKIVPVEISLGLLKKAIEMSKCNRYLIDGFPRNHDNIEGWNRLMRGVCLVEKVLFIDCNEKELERRLINRGLTSGRNDDNLETARKRFATFRESTIPVVEYYSDVSGENKNNYSIDGKSILLTVNGTKTVNEVYSTLRASVVECIQKELTDIMHMQRSHLDSSSMTYKKVVVDVTSGTSAVITYSLFKTVGSDGPESGTTTEKETEMICTDVWENLRGAWTRTETSGDRSLQ